MASVHLKSRLDALLTLTCQQQVVWLWYCGPYLCICDTCLQPLPKLHAFFSVRLGPLLGTLCLQALVGCQVTVPMSGGRTIPVIADDYVDMEFGTGALKITPGMRTRPVPALLETCMKQVLGCSLVLRHRTALVLLSHGMRIVQCSNPCIHNWVVQCPLHACTAHADLQAVLCCVVLWCCRS